MDFARKQLEKYGWKDGEGLGKTSQGISVAIKPRLKTGKEGMGFDLCQELTGTWWTKAYSDSLSRINIKGSKTEEGESLAVSLQEDDDVKEKAKKNPYAMDLEERPMEKMKKRMMKANFTSFSKGGTLSNGEMEEVETISSESTNNSGTATPVFNFLNDEDLLKACGGRTAHKTARFGHKLNGKLARIAAQEQKLLLLSTPTESPEKEDEDGISKKKRKKSKKKNKHEDNNNDIDTDKYSKLLSEDSINKEANSEGKKKKKRKLEEIVKVDVDQDEELVEVEKTKKKKKSKDKRRKSEELGLLLDES